MIITAAAATCLALNIYFEGRSESYDGQKLIAEVTMERVYTDGFPKTVCGVVWEDGAFSWTHDGKSDKPKDIDAWLTAQIIANETLLYGCELCSGATYFHTRDVHPYWADDMQMVGMYGNHVFYKGCDE
ncbi:SleB Cell wall hydrolyses involved in spore germination [uncultured Caudovirales phage]|uniref:SleB Cell wall hydrolyses involved in spore germination n=1 Tax=uncultured Caudovirales phage TaxID=2100421 RepID=A0A6J5QZV5_9CAUD|nr:SleB Cell wall hydrolyses involved in spore germination [uncultured Caudovirales phage]CAB4169407.1 SleB Cell wall hydrolyses involved in spore germination [uncultured Caudovirales phage]CAB4181290.1 SleB Cell wall hydrolyses involved in spore germination [uncultured Caudovirales phage]CAB4190169.1 SleB Cell wall hydrolyses involved in spore germination [uncultured Caudovirales phage]CAB4195962.1 SleB Cell wall hydrolyses involved in spore germination [uncultured Caudovirales phage]